MPVGKRKKELKMNIAKDDRIVTYYIVQSKRLTDGQYAIVTKAKKEHKRFQLIARFIVLVIAYPQIQEVLVLVLLTQYLNTGL